MKLPSLAVVDKIGLAINTAVATAILILSSGWSKLACVANLIVILNSFFPIFSRIPNIGYFIYDEFHLMQARLTLWANRPTMDEVVMESWKVSLGELNNLVVLLHESEMPYKQKEQ